MTDMLPTPRHSAPRAPGTVAAWAILAGAGATEIVYNVYHAVHGGSMAPALALLYGFAPIFVAALVSHIVAEHDGGWVMQTAAILVMLGAMALSIGATASVVRPAAGSWMEWLFGGVLDGATLVALRVILDSRSHQARAATELEAAQEAVQQARSEAQEATAKAGSAEAELASVRAEVESLRAALEAERQRASARKSRRSSGRKPARSSGRKQPVASAPEPVAVSGGTSAPEDVPDIDAEALILKYLAEGHSASQAGIMAGKSDSYGRQVARLARSARREPAGDERSEGDVR